MDENAIRGLRRRWRLSGAGGFPAAGSAAAADLLSIMHWVDGLVAECVVRPGLPGRDRVIDLATDVRAACRRLAAEPALGAAPPPRGNVLRVPPAARGFAAGRRRPSELRP